MIRRFFLAAGLAAALAMPAPTVSAATVLTGDRLDGVPVIERLDVSDAPLGQITRYYFRVTNQASGQGWYVPVLVARGAKPGKKLLLTAAIHGDELNGIDVIHQLFAGLDPARMSGNVVAIPGLNAPGLLNASRNFTPSHGGGGQNLNREMPDVRSSEAPGDSVGALYAGRLWSQLFIGNADAAIDLHTQSTGTVYPVYVFAETAAARRMADLIRPDVIKMDAGIKGSVENMLNAAGVPAVTLELGAPLVFDREMVRRGLRGVRNVMIDMGITPGSPDLSGPEPFLGNRSVDVTASRGGYARILVALGDRVKAGQPVATISDPFGRIIARETAPMDGQVTALATAPTREVGSMLVRILAWSDEEVCKANSCTES
jgi:predicted deacylase